MRTLKLLPIFAAFACSFFTLKADVANLSHEEFILVMRHLKLLSHQSVSLYIEHVHAGDRTLLEQGDGLDLALYRADLGGTGEATPLPENGAFDHDAPINWAIRQAVAYAHQIQPGVDEHALAALLAAAVEQALPKIVREVHWQAFWDGCCAGLCACWRAARAPLEHIGAHLIDLAITVGLPMLGVPVTVAHAIGAAVANVGDEVIDRLHPQGATATPVPQTPTLSGVQLVAHAES